MYSCCSDVWSPNYDIMIHQVSFNPHVHLLAHVFTILLYSQLESEYILAEEIFCDNCIYLNCVLEHIKGQMHSDNVHSEVVFLSVSTP